MSCEVHGKKEDEKKNQTEMQIVDQAVAPVGSEDAAPEMYLGRFYSISVYINKH